VQGHRNNDNEEEAASYEVPDLEDEAPIKETGQEVSVV
jgi:hypothetical protein